MNGQRESQRDSDGSAWGQQAACVMVGLPTSTGGSQIQSAQLLCRTARKLCSCSDYGGSELTTAGAWVLRILNPSPNLHVPEGQTLAFRALRVRCVQPKRSRHRGRVAWGGWESPLSKRTPSETACSAAL